MESSPPVNWKFIKAEIKDAAEVLLGFAKNPIEGMKSLPDWPWSKLIFLMGGFAAVCGLLRGLINRSFIEIASGVVIYPISSLLTIAIFAGLFYYIFMFFYHRELSYKKLFTHFTFAVLPAILLSTIAYIVPPITLLGTALTGLLLIVGFVENFRLPKKSVTKLLGGMFLIYIIIWIFNSISFQQKKQEFRQNALPESLDILEKELNQ